MRFEGDSTVNFAAGRVPNRTAVAPAKPLPISRTLVPPVVGPELGLTASTVGGGMTNVHAAPLLRASRYPPTSAVVPSLERARPQPKLARPLSPPPVSFGPCCAQAAERLNAQAAPTALSLSPLSWDAPISAVLPSAESATLPPNSPAPISPPTTFCRESFRSCVQLLASERAKTQAAPALPSSSLPPIRAVPPSPESATLTPKPALPTSSPPVSLCPWRANLPPATRRNTQAAPRRWSSSGPPISAIVPSEESATLPPKEAVPLSPYFLPRSSPCERHPEPERAKNQTAPFRPSVLGAPIRAVLPSGVRATLSPKSRWKFTTSLLPAQTPGADRVKAQTAPLRSSSWGAPISAVFPSAESATLNPNDPWPFSWPP